MTRRLIWLPIFLAVVTTGGAAQRIRLPAGLGELEQRAVKDSNDAAAHYNVALAYFNAKRYDDAERALRTAVTIDPKLAPAWLALSRLPFLRRPKLWDEIFERGVPDEWEPRLREAESSYRRAFLIDPLVDLRIEAIARPGRSAFWVSSPTAESIYRYFYQFQDDLLEGRYEAAYGRLNELYDNIPTIRERDGLPNFIFYYRGLAAAHIGRFREAQTDFSLLLQRAENHINPDSLVYYLPLELNEYRYMLAVLSQRGGDPNEAIRLFQLTLENDIGYYMAHVQMANIYEGTQMWPQAVQSRTRAVNANPDDASLVLDLGVTLAKAGQWAGAEVSLQQAVASSPRDARAPYYLGIVEQQLAKPAEARAAFTRFLAIAPSRYERQIADAKVRLAALQ